MGDALVIFGGVLGGYAGGVAGGGIGLIMSSEMRQADLISEGCHNSKCIPCVCGVGGAMTGWSVGKAVVSHRSE